MVCKLWGRSIGCFNCPGFTYQSFICWFCWFPWPTIDYKFERVWKHPDQDVEKLKRYRAILSPDFSMYLEMAKLALGMIGIRQYPLPRN